MCFLPPITKVLGQHLHDGASALPRLDDAAMTVALLALVASAALADDAALRTVAVDDAGDTFLGAPATYAYAAYAHPWPHPALAFEANFSVSFPAARRCGRPRVAACVLRRRNTCGTGCHYFQHAAVYLAPCLSFFARYDDLEPVVVARDGLYFGFHPWIVGFLEAAGARLVQHGRRKLKQCCTKRRRARYVSPSSSRATTRRDPSRPLTHLAAAYISIADRLRIAHRDGVSSRKGRR